MKYGDAGYGALTGQEHYRKAEELIQLAEDMTDGAVGVPEGVDLGELVPAAQVHATLALAAAHGAHLPPPSAVVQVFKAASDAAK